MEEKSYNQESLEEEFLEEEIVENNTPIKEKNENITKTEKNNNMKNDNSKLLIMILAIAVLLISIIAVIVSSLNKEEKKKPTTIFTDKQEVKSEYRLKGNHLQEFDLSFLKIENKEANMIYSPLSIKYALEMLKEGTNGESKEQLEAILGDYQPKKYTNSANMSFANAMYINQTYKNEIKDEYTQKLLDKYYAEVLFDSFENSGNINKWVGDKTFGLVNNLLDDATVKRSKFFLINALAINMEWNKVIQARQRSDGSYSVSYKNEKYSAFISPLMSGVRDNLEFNYVNGKEKIQALQIGASINNYDIVSDLGRENIRKTITEEYNEYIKINPCGGTPTPTEEFVENFIRELDSNYRRLDYSTDFEFYVDEDVKLFAKDLKTYDGTTLRYIGIMPINDNLTDYIDKTSATVINDKIKSLKSIKRENFKEGVITKINGYIPTFKFEYELKLKEDLKKLKVTDIFDKEKADLSLLTTAKDTFIDTAIHKANIDFSNEGIKASAATAIGGDGSASCGFEHLYEVPVEVIDLTFDKPYMFLIQDKNTQEVWFTGTVYEPNKKLN